MATWKFRAPGGLTDFSDAEVWHQAMVGEAEDIVRFLVLTALGREPVDEQEFRQVAGSLAYVNPVQEAPPTTAETIPVTPWGGFPRAVRRRAPWTDLPADPDDPDGTLRAADHTGDEDFRRGGVFIDHDDNLLHLPVRDRQDEYLEWTLRRDGSGRITKAIFVAEGYDYFSRLFQHDEKRVAEIYAEFVEIKDLTPDDLRAPKGIFRRTALGTVEVVPPGAFNPRNRFNIAPGIVHLSHRANSLGAEVNLAGVSGIARRTVNGALLDGVDAERLLCCAEGGNPNRNSDPLIGQQAYAQVLGGFRYTLANPVGLYIAGVETSRLTLPNGQTEVPSDWWKTIRGTSEDHRTLRLELSVPASEHLTVSDLLVDGLPVKFGGQLAELLTVHLFVTRWPRGTPGHGPVVGCAATCCRQVGGPNLVVTEDAKCTTGFVLAFDDLLGPPGPNIAEIAARAAAAGPARTLPKRPSRRLP
jgi:hypothetical protein